MEEHPCRKCKKAGITYCGNEHVILCENCLNDHLECVPGLRSIPKSSKILSSEASISLSNADKHKEPSKKAMSSMTNLIKPPTVNVQLEKAKELCQSKSAEMIHELEKLKSFLQSLSKDSIENPPDFPSDLSQILQVKMNLNLIDPVKLTYYSTRTSIISVDFHNDRYETKDYDMQSDLLLYSSIAYVNGNLFLIGGLDLLGIPSDLFMKVSLENKSVTSVCELPTPRVFSATIVKDLKIYVFGGITLNQSGTSSILLFDTQENCLSHIGELSHPHKKTSACLIKDSIYIASSDSPIVERFSVLKNTTETLKFHTNSLPFCMVFNFQNDLHLLTDCKVLTETSELFGTASSMRWGQSGVIQWKQGVFYVNYLNNKLEKFNIFSSRIESFSL